MNSEERPIECHYEQCYNNINGFCGADYRAIVPDGTAHIPAYCPYKKGM